MAPPARKLYIELEIQVKYEKQIRNLQLQESRLHRRRTRDLAELRLMQHEREGQRAEELAAAAEAYREAKSEGREFTPADAGFEFSIAEIERFMTRQTERPHRARAHSAASETSSRL